MQTSDVDHNLIGAYRAILHATAQAQAGGEFARCVPELRKLAKLIGLPTLKKLAEPFRKVGYSNQVIAVRHRSADEKFPLARTPAKMKRDLLTIEFGGLVLASTQEVRDEALREAWEKLGQDQIDIRNLRNRFQKFKQLCSERGVIPILEKSGTTLVPVYPMSALEPRKAGRKPNKK